VLPWYLGALVLGGVLIGASIVMGGGDADLDADHDLDFDADVDADVDVDADFDVDADADIDLDGDVEVGQDVDHFVEGDAGGWLPFLSLRFWTFALMSFGLTGTLSQLLLDVARPVELGTSLAVGLAIGWAAAWAFRTLKRNTVTGQTQLTGLRGTEAIVLLPVGPDKTGKIRALVDGQAVDLMARTRDDALMARKEPVLVVSIDDGVAVVTPLRRLPAGAPTPDPESSP